MRGQLSDGSTTGEDYPKAIVSNICDAVAVSNVTIGRSGWRFTPWLWMLAEWSGPQALATQANSETGPLTNHYMLAIDQRDKQHRQCGRWQ